MKQVSDVEEEWFEQNYTELTIQYFAQVLGVKFSEGGVCGEVQ